MRITDVHIVYGRSFGVSYPSGFRENESEYCEVRIVLRCSPEEAAAIYNMRGRPVDVRSAQEGPPQLPEHGAPEVLECRVEDVKALPPKSSIP